MAREKNLSTIVKGERVRVQMVPGRLVLVPRDQAVVQLAGGAFDKIPVDTVAIEAEGAFRMGTYSRLYDLTNEQDRQTIELLKLKLEENPHWASHKDYQIKIVGEFEGLSPWAGYDGQTAEQVETLFRAMPDAARPSLEQVMKYELDRVDEDGNSITDDDKVKVLNKLYREQEVAEKDAAEETVAL